MRLDDEMEVWIAARDVDAVIEPVPHVLMHDAVAARQSLVEQDFAEQGNDPTPTFALGLEELQPLLRIAVCVPAQPVLLDHAFHGLDDPISLGVGEALVVAQEPIGGSV